MAKRTAQFLPARHRIGRAHPQLLRFLLPPEVAGPVQVEVDARSGTVGALRPFVMLESTVHKMEQRSIALTIAVYAGLFTLALVMLALFHAAHDRAFLSLFAFSISTLLMLAALNGHLYLLPGFRALGAWRKASACCCCCSVRPIEHLLA